MFSSCKKKVKDVALLAGASSAILLFVCVGFYAYMTSPEVKDNIGGNNFCSKNKKKTL